MLKRYKSKHPRLQVGEIVFVDGYFETDDDYLQGVIENSEMFQNYVITVESVSMKRGDASNDLEDFFSRELTPERLQELRRGLAGSSKDWLLAVGQKLGLAVTEEMRAPDIRKVVSAKIKEMLAEYGADNQGDDE